ncbi:hypothetical protein [Amycolatopsis sp. cmx-8-4]|uniref:hypothetical protein n=1 Tax=Amycolatopsis sp. cmx-8-4 TaxID=2790947 RepID=UPI0039783026
MSGSRQPEPTRRRWREDRIDALLAGHVREDRRVEIDTRGPVHQVADRLAALLSGR